MLFCLISPIPYAVKGFSCPLGWRIVGAVIFSWILSDQTEQTQWSLATQLKIQWDGWWTWWVLLWPADLWHRNWKSKRASAEGQELSNIWQPGPSATRGPSLRLWPIRWLMPPFPVLGGWVWGGKGVLAGVREMGGKLGRSPFLLVGVEGIPMRREKSLSMYHRLTVCPFFANEISGIRLALLWISDTFKMPQP